MLKETIKKELTASINQAFPESISEDLIGLETPRQKSHGDFATNLAFKLAKTFKKAPPLIAEEIANKINENKQLNFSIEPLNGFMNIRLKDSFLFDYFSQLLTKKPSFPQIGKQINLEFLSANPTGPLHIGHGRWAVIGNALCRLLSYTEQSFKSENYINDAGVQIKNLLASIQAIKEGHAIPEDGYHGDYIKELAKSDADPVQCMLAQHKETLQRLAIDFDTWFSEKSLYDNDEVKRCLDFLKQQHFSYEKDGATWFKSSDFADDKDRVLIKSDGNYTYFLVDIAYHYNKINRGFTDIINIWGADHHGYVPRMAAAIKALTAANNKSTVSFKVIIGQLVNLFRDGQAVRMSKRTGDIITLDEVIDEIGADAIRYFLLEKNADTTLDFDLSLAVKQNSENPVFYVQYAHARMCTLQQKVSGTATQRITEAELNTEERQLIYLCSNFYDEVWDATQHFAPYKLVAFAYSIAKSFHSFYESCPIQQADDPTKARRLAIVKQCKNILAESLRLLGISAPETM